MAETSTNNLYTLLLRMADTMNSQNIDLFSCEILYMDSCSKLHINSPVQFFMFLLVGRINFHCDVSWCRFSIYVNLCLTHSINPSRPFNSLLVHASL
jgi:hypothetical protein